MSPRGVDLPGVPAALPADHDDHHGGAARRRCRSRSARGTGAELRRPLGITIVGGLLLSQVLTLYTTPVIYLYMERLGALPRKAASTTRRAASADAGSAVARVNISAPFIRRPIATSLLAAALLLAGAAAFTQLPVAPLPRVDFPDHQRAARRCPAPAPRPWPRRWRRRSSAASAASPASPR